MPYITENTSLKALNTFGVDVKARYLVRFVAVDDVIEFLVKKRFWGYPWLVLGGGSNIVFTHDYTGVVLRPDIRGIDVIKEDDQEVELCVGAGEIWDDLVAYTTAHGFAGLENLSDIPGTVGAAPVQNIGAYGLEVQDCLTQVTYVDMTSCKLHHLSPKDCLFGYRDSIFKHALKDKAIITHVHFLLKKNPRHITIRYAALEERIASIPEPSIRDVRNCVKAIRAEKLPDYKLHGNAGSFFKNPLVPQPIFLTLKAKYPDLTAYEQEDGSFKMSAAWLIEKAGWKGRRKGRVACHEKQPLVLINRGQAKGAEIARFAQSIRKSVEEQFGIALQTEVNIL